MTNNLNIRAAASSDLQSLVEIARKSFWDTFAPYPENSRADLESYMDEVYTHDAILAELQEPGVNYFVAEIDGVIAGYAKLKQDSIETGITAAAPIELCRLYNLQEFIGKGVGKALMLNCLDFAARNAHDTLWLGVWEKNERAIDFYLKFGFEQCGQHVFQLGNDAQTDWLMQRSVNSADLQYSATSPGWSVVSGNPSARTR